MVPSMVNDLYIIRFAVCAKHATDDDMHVAFHVIQEHADNVINEYRVQRAERQSASVDSLEAAVKQASIASLEREVTPSQERVVSEAPVEVTNYPITKFRVIN